MWVRLDIIRMMIQLGSAAPCWHSASMLFLFSYAFMLRLPSEALPVCVGNKVALEGLSAAICKEGDAIVLRLLTSKNRQEGATLKR